MTNPVTATTPNPNPNPLVNDKRGFSLGSFGTPTGQGEIMFGSSYDQAVSGRECERKGKRVIYSGHHS